MSKNKNPDPRRAAARELMMDRAQLGEQNKNAAGKIAETLTAEGAIMVLAIGSSLDGTLTVLSPQALNVSESPEAKLFIGRMLKMASEAWANGAGEFPGARGLYGVRAKLGN